MCKQKEDNELVDTVVISPEILADLRKRSSPPPRPTESDEAPDESRDP